MRIYFFDSSALQHRYFNGKSSRSVRRIIGSSKAKCIIADSVVLEMCKTLANRCRQKSYSHRRYAAAERRFFADIATSRLNIQKTTPRDVMNARDLLRFSHLIKKRNMGSADALLAATALELARQLRKKITFCTSDTKLYNLLREIDSYKKGLWLRYFVC